MIPGQLQVCERELRKAITRRQYDEVARRMDELRKAADQSDAAERQEIAAWVLTTIEWARLMIVTQRHNWVKELEQFPRVDRFIDAPGAAKPEVCLDF